MEGKCCLDQLSTSDILFAHYDIFHLVVSDSTDLSGDYSSDVGWFPRGWGWGGQGVGSVDQQDTDHFCYPHIPLSTMRRVKSSKVRRVVSLASVSFTSVQKYKKDKHEVRELLLKGLTPSTKPLSLVNKSGFGIVWSVER